MSVQLCRHPWPPWIEDVGCRHLSCVSVLGAFIYPLKWTWLSCSQQGVCVCVCVSMLITQSGVCVCVCVYVYVSVLVTQLYLTLCNPMDCSPPGYSVHGFSRQEYWSGLPFSSLGDLSDPELESHILHYRQILCHLSHQESPNWDHWTCIALSQSEFNGDSVCVRVFIIQSYPNLCKSRLLYQELR